MTALSKPSSLSRWWVVMGVSGCGKSSLGHELARHWNLSLIEGDDFHPPENIEKMRRGVALNDSDRAGWLQSLGEALAAHPEGAVLTCSALKRSYRDTLRSAVPGLCFAFMAITRDEAKRRVQARAGTHFFSSSLVDNQFDTLQDPHGEPGVLTVDATKPIHALVREIDEATRADRKAATA